MTLSIAGTPDERRRDTINEAVRRQGGTATWRVHSTIGRTYALLEFGGAFDAAAIRAAADAEVYETAIIALAVSPAVPQALPRLVEALGGRGRPAGILACIPFTGGVVVEWDPDATRAGVVLGLIDVELRRFASGRTAELLAPLPAAAIAKVAAEGLQAPEVGLGRVLEVLIRDA